MRLLRRTVRSGAVLGCLACLAASGCGSSSDASDGGEAGTGGAGGVPSGPSALSFTGGDPLELIPGQAHELEITATPAGPYTVRFSLLGDYKDAALDTTEANTDTKGKAWVSLTAPASGTTFTVRASVGETVSAKLGVSVSDSGFATLQVAPIYEGDRTVSHWVASVRTGTSCAALAGEPTVDGDLKGTAPNGQIPQIGSVPVGPTLAVLLRGAYSIAGCQDVGNVLPGEVNSIKVAVKDLPMQLAGTNLSLSLGLEQPKGDIVTLLNAEGTLMAMSSGATDDIKALLDAMQAATPDASSAAAFAAARKNGAWENVLFGTIGGPQAIQKLATPWLQKGVQELTGPDALTGSLKSAGATPGHAVIELEEVGGAAAARAELSSTTLASWSALPDDTVLLGTTFFFLPSRLVTALALGPAQLAVPGAITVPDALATSLDCAAIGSALAGSSQAYPGCNAACIAALCHEGLEAMWQKARDASATELSPATLLVSATAAATVDDDARPTSFSGTWIGALSSGAKTLPLAGTALGAAPSGPK